MEETSNQPLPFKAYLPGMLVLVIGGAIAIGGVIVLSKYHPDAIDRREKAAARAAAAAASEA